MLMVAASASAIEPGISYAIVPADASAQANGMLLTVNNQGDLAYTNELSAATCWTQEIGEFDENFNIPNYLTNGGKYLQIGETAAKMETDKAMTFVSYSQEVENAMVITNYNRFWYPAMDVEPRYLNALNLTTEPETSEATAFFFVEVDENSTLADVQNAIWKLSHPEAMVIAVGGATARNHGKYMAVTDEGRLITTNTLNDNAVWERGWDDEVGEIWVNMAVKGCLYQGNQSRNITLSQTPVEINIVPSEVLIGAIGITTTPDARPNNSVFLNALNTKNNNTGEDGGIGIWSLDEGSSFFTLSYDPGVTADEIDAKVTELYSLGKAKVSGLNNLKNYINASWAGREYGIDYIYQAENTETIDDFNEAIAEGTQAAIQFAEMSLTEGSVLHNVRLNMAAGYIEGDDAKPYQRVADPDLNCVWTAEIIEGADTVIEGISYNTFYLRNNISNTYMGRSTQRSLPMPAVTDLAEAGQFRLVPGNNGLQILQINALYTNEPAFVNISSNPAAPELTTWKDNNDAGNFFTFDLLPSFGEDQVVAIEADGDYEIMDQTKVYKSIKAVRVCVPVGSAVTGVGNVSLLTMVEDFFGMEEEVTVLNTWTGEVLKAVEPTVEKIGVQRYDYEIWDYVTDSIEAQVYTLPLAEEITAPGQYGVSVEKLAFSLTIDKEPVFSPEFSEKFDIKGYAVVPVTPEAGIVEDFTSIAIDPDGLEEWGVSWSYNGEENLTVTFNGEIAKDADGNELDLTGEDLMAYDGTDWTTWEGGGWIIPVDFTEAGTYVLTIPQGMLEKENYMNELTVVEWTVEKKDGILEITTVKVNGQAYDLQGRPVANPTRGLYIIDGVKTFVK